MAFSEAFLFGVSYEMEFPKDADMKPPREFFYPLASLLILSF